MIRKRTLIALSSAFAVLLSNISAAEPNRIPFEQLIKTPKRFNHKRISVVGYFEATETHSPQIRASRTKQHQPGDSVFVELAPQQLKDLLAKGSRSGYFQITGEFEYKNLKTKKIPVQDTDEFDRTIVIGPTGFGWMGVYDKKIAKITEIKPAR
jgi:hypothetical protein